MVANVVAMTPVKGKLKNCLLRISQELWKLYTSTAAAVFFIERWTLGFGRFALGVFRVSSNSKCVFVPSGFSVSHFSIS